MLHVLAILELPEGSIPRTYEQSTSDAYRASTVNLSLRSHCFERVESTPISIPTLCFSAKTDPLFKKNKSRHAPGSYRLPGCIRNPEQAEPQGVGPGRGHPAPLQRRDHDTLPTRSGTTGARHLSGTSATFFCLRVTPSKSGTWRGVLRSRAVLREGHKLHEEA